MKRGENYTSPRNYARTINGNQRGDENRALKVRIQPRVVRFILFVAFPRTAKGQAVPSRIVHAMFYARIPHTAGFLSEYTDFPRDSEPISFLNGIAEI